MTLSFDYSGAIGLTDQAAKTIATSMSETFGDLAIGDSLEIPTGPDMQWKVRLDKFLADCQLYIADYPAYAAANPDTSNVVDYGYFIKYQEQLPYLLMSWGLFPRSELAFYIRDRDGAMPFYQAHYDMLKKRPELFGIAWRGAPLPKTPEGYSAYRATLENLQPPVLASSLLHLRQWSCYLTFKQYANPDASWPHEKSMWAYYESIGRSIYTENIGLVLQSAPHFWDAPGMFYPVSPGHSQSAKVWRSVMDQFYGAMPPAYLLKGQPGYITYGEQYKNNNGAIALTEYAPALNALFSELPVTAAETIAGKKPPYYTAGEADNFFQLKAGTNLQNMIMFCQWIMAGAPPDAPPQYKKQQAPPSSGDIALSVVLGFAGFALAFVGVPAIIGALSVVTQKIVENYQLDKAEELAKESAKVETQTLAIAKEQAQIQRQIEAINAEREALQTGSPVKSVLGEKRNAITLGLLTLLAAMVI